MPYKDAEKQREYQRQYQRAKRAGEINPGKTLHPEDIKTAKGLLDLLAATMADVQGAKADTLIKARCIGYLISIGLKCVETADICERLAALEERAGNIH